MGSDRSSRSSCFAATIEVGARDLERRELRIVTPARLVGSARSRRAGRPAAPAPAAMPPPASRAAGSLGLGRRRDPDVRTFADCSWPTTTTASTSDRRDETGPPHARAGEARRSAVARNRSTNGEQEDEVPRLRRDVRVGPRFEERRDRQREDGGDDEHALRPFPVRRRTRYDAHREQRHAGPERRPVPRRRVPEESSPRKCEISCSEPSESPPPPAPTEKRVAARSATPHRQPRARSARRTRPRCGCARRPLDGKRDDPREEDERSRTRDSTSAADRGEPPPSSSPPAALLLDRPGERAAPRAWRRRGTPAYIRAKSRGEEDEPARGREDCRDDADPRIAREPRREERDERKRRRPRRRLRRAGVRRAVRRGGSTDPCREEVEGRPAALGQRPGGVFRRSCDRPTKSASTSSSRIAMIRA